MASFNFREKTFFYLLGKTGTGKSATGNTILQRKDFTASADSTASTKFVTSAETGLGDWIVVVVDGPGLVELDRGYSSANLRQFEQIIAEHPTCGHVFLIVCRYGDRFTAEDSEMVRHIKNEFGRNIFSNRGIVLVTFGDNFQADHEDENTTFESWCRSQGGDFGRLVNDCGQRVLLVDNSPKASRNQDLLLKLKSHMSAIAYGNAPINLSQFRDRPFTEPPAEKGCCDSFKDCILRMCRCIPRCCIACYGELKDLCCYVGAAR